MDEKEGRNLSATFRSHSPVGGDVANEQDAGIHVEVEGGGAEVAVELVEWNRVAGVVGDADGEAKADEEVGGGQVLQVDGDAGGRRPLSAAEVNLQGEAVEVQTNLPRRVETVISGFGRAEETLRVSHQEHQAVEHHEDDLSPSVHQTGGVRRARLVHGRRPSCPDKDTHVSEGE